MYRKYTLALEDRIGLRFSMLPSLIIMLTSCLESVYLITNSKSENVMKNPPPSCEIRGDHGDVRLTHVVYKLFGTQTTAEIFRGVHQPPQHAFKYRRRGLHPCGGEGGGLECEVHITALYEPIQRILILFKRH